jgi:hypothetical protein
MKIWTCLPETLRDSGIIRPYNAAYTAAHRKQKMKLFKEGVIRILVCTDAAGMVSYWSNKAVQHIDSPCARKYFNRTVIYLTLILLSNRNFLRQFHLLYS